jgi:heterodisulfide reductase subunit C
MKNLNAIEVLESPTDLAYLINKISGENINTCIQCYSCASVCPFFEFMGNAPHHLIRMIQYGLRDEVLRSPAIWICVGCHTCSSQCPAAIDLVEVMDTLRHLALKEKNNIPEYDVVNFHEQLVNSISRHGRTHKLEIMLGYKLKSGGWFDDMDVGLQMFKKRKLDILPHNIKDLSEIKKMFSEAAE